MRLDKFLSESTPFSRKEIKQLIKAGAVEVNGEKAQKPEQKTSDKDTVSVNGEIVSYRKFIYLLLDKPAGYVSATEDKKYPCVTELVPEEYAHYGVFPVGRLDIDTEGLLILTNDGGLAHDVTSPKKNVYKRYFARLDTPANQKTAEEFASGMVFVDFTAKPAKLEICDDPKEVYTEIAEGKYHQVKRMFARTGHEVLYLRRTAIGGLTLPDGSKPGDIYEISINNLVKKLNNVKKL